MNFIQKSKLECPIAIRWTISENRLKEFKNQPGKCLASDWFNASNIPGVQYRLELYPNGVNFEEGAFIFLILKYSEDDKIESKFKIEASNYCYDKEYVFQKYEGCGTMWCLYDELFDPEKRFIVNGKMTIKMEGTLMIEKEIPEKMQLFGDGHSDLLCLGLWEQEESKDFTVVADGQKITAHKIILATRSSVFTKMFQSGMKESKENKVIIKDFSFDIVKKALKFCYHSKLAGKTTLEDKMKLLQFFDKYDIQLLKDEFEIYLVSEVDASNVCRLANASLLSNASKLEEKCSEFIQECLHERKPISNFNLLDKDFALNAMKNAFFNVSV